MESGKLCRFDPALGGCQYPTRCKAPPGLDVEVVGLVKENLIMANNPTKLRFPDAGHKKPNGRQCFGFVGDAVVAQCKDGWTGLWRRDTNGVGAYCIHRRNKQINLSIFYWGKKRFITIVKFINFLIKEKNAFVYKSGLCYLSKNLKRKKIISACNEKKRDKTGKTKTKTGNKY